MENQEKTKVPVWFNVLDNNIYQIIKGNAVLSELVFYGHEDEKLRQHLVDVFRGTTIYLNGKI